MILNILAKKLTYELVHDEKWRVGWKLEPKKNNYEDVAKIANWNEMWKNMEPALLYISAGPVLWCKIAFKNWTITCMIFWACQIHCFIWDIGRTCSCSPWTIAWAFQIRSKIFLKNCIKLTKQINFDCKIISILNSMQLKLVK